MTIFGSISFENEDCFNPEALYCLDIIRVKLQDCSNNLFNPSKIYIHCIDTENRHRNEYNTLYPDSQVYANIYRL